MTIANNINFIESEVTTSNISQKPLVQFNDSETMFSPNQPIFIKTGSTIQWKNTGEVVLGDMIININTESNEVTYVEVKTITNLPEADVYEIRTEPFLWFIVGNYLVVS